MSSSYWEEGKARGLEEEEGERNGCCCRCCSCVGASASCCFGGVNHCCSGDCRIWRVVVGWWAREEETEEMGGVGR